jgi:hypothetical protein
VFGNRIEKAVDPDGDGPNAAVVTRYMLDGWNNSKPTPVGNEHFDVYAELDGTNQLLARYLHGDEFDQTFARVRYGEPGVSTPGFLPEVHWRLTDHLNSVRLVLPPSRRRESAVPYFTRGLAAAAPPTMLTPVSTSIATSGWPIRPTRCRSCHRRRWTRRALSVPCPYQRCALRGKTGHQTATIGRSGQHGLCQHKRRL